MELDYLFVNANIDGRSQNDPQRRSHVMQQYYRATRKGTDGTPSQPRLSHVPPSLPSAKTRFRLNQHNGPPDRRLSRFKKRYPQTSRIEAQEGGLPISDRDRDTSNSQTKDAGAYWAVTHALPKHPLIPFGSCRVDPFDVLPVRLDLWDEYVLDHLISHKRYPWCPLNGENRWCRFALSDALVLHVTLFAWSVSHDHHISDVLTSSWLKRNPNIIQHKIATIALLKERIPDPEEVIKDETIAAVTLVTLIDVKYGDEDGAVTHLNGLRMIVDLGGGFLTFMSDIQLLVQRLTSWTDLMISELTSRPPIFPPAQVWENSWRTLDAWHADTPSLGLTLTDLSIASVPHHTVIGILYAIHRLCYEEQHRPLRTLSEHARMQRGDMFHKIERQLTDILHSDHSNTAWLAVTLTALIFVHHFLRGESLVLRQFRPLTSQLQNVLSQISDDLDELAFNRALVYWVLSIGAIISTYTPHHDYFLDRIRIASLRYSVAWPQVRTLLMQFLWTGRDSEVEYYKVWQAGAARTCDGI